MVNHVSSGIADVAGAGFETTANALQLLRYFVFNNPEILQRLRAELAEV